MAKLFYFRHLKKLVRPETKYCFQLCSDMKGNSVSLTSSAYFNPNFVSYDTVAVY